MKKISIIGLIGKIAGIILLIFVLLIVIFITAVMIITKSNDAYKGDFKSVVKSNDLNARKALLVYQPAKSKASEKIAEQLAKGLKEAGYEVTLTYPGKHVSEDVSGYSLIAFGSPVFFGKPSAVLKDTMKKLTDLSDKTIIIYSVGQLTESTELDVMKECLGSKSADYAVKFSIKEKTVYQKAYELGLEAGEEGIESKW